MNKTSERVELESKSDLSKKKAMDLSFFLLAFFFSFWMFFPSFCFYFRFDILYWYFSFVLLHKLVLVSCKLCGWCWCMFRFSHRVRFGSALAVSFLFFL